MITVVDYGMGNLRNVRRAFEEAGQQVLITADPADVGRADLLVLPGVGAFGEAVRRIEELGLRGSLLQFAASGKPMLGICLGMQLLYDQSEESPGVTGLGILRGTIVRFSGNRKVPHIGWNDVVPTTTSPLFGDEGGVFYFVHSYYAPVGSETVAETEYGLRFSAAVQQGRVFGVQFHPEKSQAVGLELVRRFTRLLQT